MAGGDEAGLRDEPGAGRRDEASEGPAVEAGAGLRDEEPPRIPGPAIATAIGGLWGLVGYEILWEAIPFGVDRRFVTSPIGTLALLPVRLVLWAIHEAEGLAGHTFDFSGNFGWIGLLASVAGAVIVGGGFLSVRTTIRRLRRRRGG